MHVIFKSTSIPTIIWPHSVWLYNASIYHHYQSPMYKARISVSQGVLFECNECYIPIHNSVNMY